MLFVREIQYRLGIDKSIFFTSMARVIQGFGGVISVFLVAKYLTGVEQGFYYTFASLAAIQIFFELGLNGIITQYVAHEVSHLYWDSPVSLAGDEKYRSRLSSLLHFSVKWYLYFAFFLFFVLIIVGFVFFNTYGVGSNVSWKAPWILLALGTALNLLLAPILAFVEGLGKVKEVAKIRLYQQCVGLLVVWGGLIYGCKLYISGANGIVSILLAVVLMYLSPFKKILSHIWYIPIKEKVDYKKEIFPYQWKIALSWVSGYFIFQLFNPVLFATDGAVVAGQMGMTLAALNSIFALSFSWISTKIPLYSSLIAQRKFEQLDILFNKTLKQSLLINGLFLCLMFGIVFIIRQFHIMLGEIDIGSRLLPYLPMLLMMIPLFINQLVGSWATYLRCHKREPFLINSLISGGLCSLSTIFLGRYFGVVGITGGYCVITLIMSFWGYRIFVIKKNEWHEKS